MEKEVLILLVILSILVQNGTPYFCNLTSSIDKSRWPKLPDLPESFTTNIEINIVDQNSTLDAVEYFDNFGNRVALHTTKEGLNGVVVYDFNTNEVFYVTHGVCMVANITQRPEADLFGVTESDGRLHVMTSNTALKFGQQYNETYIGPDVIRGINVDHWRACLHWTRIYANFTVDYYFSRVNEWKTSSAYETVPVRADVTGEYIHSDGSTRPIHHVYEYHAFTGSIEVDATVFETPPGVICQGRKKTKPVPPFPQQFYYRQEIVVEGIVTFRDVWYDENYKYLRYDSRPLSPTNQFYTTNPITEIQDFNTGVHFFRDNILGNCTIVPLKKTSFGAKVKRSATNSSGYFMLDMQNPLELFYLDKGFTYVGERPCRDMTCDVYSSIRNDIIVNGANDTANTTIEIFLLNSDSMNYPDDGQDVPQIVPVRMTLEADSIGFSETIQIYDFNNASPDLSVFDVSSCYNDMAKLHFNVRFPGLIRKDRHKALLELTQVKFAQTMGIEITRIQDLRLDVDIADLYVHATLLDRTPTDAQFSYVGNLEVVDLGDMYIGQVLTPMQCADLCVATTNFSCNSFDFCQDDPQKTCRLNRKHISDGLKVKNGSSCGHFSRTVNGPLIPEMTILEAYQKLRLAVYATNFMVQVEFDNQEMAYYIGVDTSIEFGAAKPTIMPKLSGQFSYHQEVVIPRYAQTFESQVWYDSTLKFVQYDYHDAKPTAPYYTTNPMTMIHDFNTGLQYSIDKYYKNCTITPITAGQFDSEIDNIQEYLKDKSYVIKMKSPLELFHTDIQTRYIGQRTVRNLLCDVFLGEIKSYSTPGLTGTHPAIVQYYFLTKGWTEVGKDNDDNTPSVPVKLDITIVDKGLYITYNFFDFELLHTSLFVPDIQQCYTDLQQHRFQIQFPGQFHPYLDINQKIFIEEAQIAISQSSDVSLIRIQGTRLDHDEDSIYITATLMDKAPFLAVFTKIPGKVFPRKTNGLFRPISTPDDCAHACVQTKSFPCNSFDICPSIQYCFLSNEHIQDGHLLSNKSMCDHYSRTVNASSEPTPDLYTAYISLKNDVFAGIININVPIANNKVKTYTASSIRDTLIQKTDVPQGGRPLRSFSLFKNNVIYKHNDETLQGLAVDDCAVSCLMEETFDCQSFEYCTATELCYLSKIQPDINSTLLVQSSTCNLYSRQYLSRYDKTPGAVYTTPGYQTINGIQTDNMCAKQCSQRTECKSFDYCANTQKCQLRKTHKLDMPNNTITTQATCNHYSRKYVDDFVIKVGRDMTIDSSREILGITVDQCAKLCIEQEAINCKSFIYCGNQTVCQLKSMSPREAPIVASQYCDLYTRRFFPGSLPPSPTCNNSNIPQTSNKPMQTVSVSSSPTHPPQISKHATNNPQTGNSNPPPNSSSASHSQQNNNSRICSTPEPDAVTKNNPGVIIGVAFGVFLPGLIFGAFIAHFYKRYKIRSDDMNMHIINMNYSPTK